jgi:2-oxoglutarate dehydrogenase E2 component (dihydrolipoamide succinyltransferase)
MAVDMKAPSPGESISEVQIVSWLKGDGEYVEKDEPICEIESDKATLELPAEASGTLSIKVQAEEIVPVGTILCSIDPAGQPAKGAVPKKAAKAAPISTPTASGNGHASGTPSPAAGKILAERGLSPEQVAGTGRGGRITKHDAATAQAGAASTKTAVVPGDTRPVKRVKMSMLRRSLARRLVEVKNQTAMLTTFNEVDMSAVIALRKKEKAAFEKAHGVKLGFMSFFTHACVEALTEFSAVNAYIDGDEIVYPEHIDIGIAVSTPKGLMVPVMRNVQTMSAADVEKSIRDYAARAQDGKLSIDEMTGGTFTITNGGVFGSMLSTPIINPPQSAILGMHNIVERPVAVAGKVEIRPIMYVALSYDHRIIDGRESVSFLKKVKERIESPDPLFVSS